MNPIKIRIDGTPKAVQSFRFAQVGGFTRKYQPQQTVDWKNYIRIVARQQLPDGFKPIEDMPLSVAVVFVFAPPKSLRRAEKLHIEAGGLIWKFTRPDLADNLKKGVFDALTGIVWKDDGMIAQDHGSKFYGSHEYTEITVKRLEQPIGGASK